MRTFLRLLAFVTITIVMHSTAFAQQYLTGELSGSYPTGEYNISGNVHVLPKATLSFAPGSVLRFDNFTGIIVRGKLICKGTPPQPIIFTSSHDVPNTKTMPEAFDWNGIKVTSEASGITFEHCAIAYSTFGLNIESNATPVSIKNVSFHHNGSASFSREKKMMQVQENTPISFNWPAIVQPNTPGNETAKKSGNLPDINREKSEKTAVKVTACPKKTGWIKTVRITCAGTAIAGGALWLTGHLQAEHYNTLFLKPDAPLSTRNGYKNSRDGWVTVRNIGIGLFSLGAAGFAITFVF